MAKLTWYTGLWMLFQTAPITEEISLKNRPSEQNGVAKQRTAAAADLPDDLPTMVQIKQSVPKHCFEPTVSQSMYYVAQDIVLIIALYFALEYTKDVVPSWAMYFITPFYWLMQGTAFTAIFVLGHDCGHGSFSKHKFLNDFMGTFLHGFLLTPFYCWKLSHHIHHKFTGNIDKDEVFYPVRKRDTTSGLLIPWFGLGVGWFTYLVRGYKPRQVGHFNPFNPMFTKHVIGCTVSIAVNIIWGLILYRYAQHAGWYTVFYHYVVPVYIFASWCVIFTFLHHTEPSVPWFSDEKWSFVRGQLSSIDRDYGWAHGLTHDIGTHQIHHLFTKVPHYHLKEATQHFRKTFPDLVRYSTEPILPVFIRNFYLYAKQSVIPDDVEIFRYK